MNEFQLMIHRLKRFLSQLGSSGGSGGVKKNPGRPDLKMCPICRNLVASKSTSCEYCKADLDPKPQPTRNLDGSSTGQPINPSYIVFGLCCLVYFLTTTLSGKVEDYNLVSELWSPEATVLIRTGANFLPQTLYQVPLAQRFAIIIENYEWWRIATYMFLHGSLMHIFFNLSALGQLGGMTWGSFGTRRFWLISFLTGMAGGLLSILAAVVGLQPGFSVGFSGALFGYIGANYYYFKNHGLPEVAERLKKFMIWGNLIFIGLTVFFRLMPGPTSFGIDNAAHIGGMLMGLLLGKIFDLRWVRILPPVVERLILTACVLFWCFGLFRCGQYIYSWLG